MDVDKGTGHDVSFCECTSASLELVLPSRYHLPVRLLGSVLLCHHLPLPLSWLSGESVCHPQVSGPPSWNLVRIHHFLHKAVSSVLHGGNQEMCILWEWQVQKINFLVWKHEMVMVLGIKEWEHLKTFAPTFISDIF